jgi:RsiW-degrading membrane proteinase PrsW (M82 family)
MRKIVRFAWHLTSVYFVAMGALLFYYSRNPKDATVLTMIALTCFISAVVTFGASRGRHFAWPVFTIVGLIAWLSRN